MKVLVINCGSSSLKYQVIDSETEHVLAKGLCERIGIDGVLTYQPAGQDKIKYEAAMPAHRQAVELVLKQLTNPENGILKSIDEIDAVGHRMVHGGEKFSSSVLIDEEVIREIDECSALAPLHNPANILGIRACQKIMPGVPNVAVFDTAFHSTMPKESYIYALPMKYYDEYKIRRYGFHGTSHKYVSLRCAELMNKKVEDTKIITCHLGNGASITAVDGGKSINTSMGFTPLAGVMMGTRCGDIDPAIVTYIMKKTGATPDEMDDIMNMQSGMLGVSGISSDARDIEDGCKEGNPAALLTAEVYVNRVINVVGGYYAQLGGADAIVFTGGIGENDTNMRKMICDRLSVAFGIQLDEELNGKTRGKEVLLSTAESKVAVWLIPTNEELMIARDTYRLIA